MRLINRARPHRAICHRPDLTPPAKCVSCFRLANSTPYPLREASFFFIRPFWESVSCRNRALGQPHATTDHLPGRAGAPPPTAIAVPYLVTRASHQRAVGTQEQDTIPQGRQPGDPVPPEVPVVIRLQRSRGKDLVTSTGILSRR
jgi:hypothetical protein